MCTPIMSNLHDPTGYFSAYRYFSHASGAKRTSSYFDNYRSDSIFKRFSL